MVPCVLAIRKAGGPIHERWTGHSWYGSNRGILQLQHMNQWIMDRFWAEHGLTQLIFSGEVKQIEASPVCWCVDPQNISNRSSFLSIQHSLNIFHMSATSCQNRPAHAWETPIWFCHQLPVLLSPPNPSTSCASKACRMASRARESAALVGWPQGQVASEQGRCFRDESILSFVGLNLL